MTLHHMDIAMRYADRMVIVKDSEKYAEGKPMDVFTEKMLADVYRVDTTVFQDEHGHLHMDINGPLDGGRI